MSAQTIEKVPRQAWITTFAGTAINLCLGILYAWSIWKSALADVDRAGEVMTGLNEGWIYLTNAQAATPFSLCIIMFALMMIPGGRVQDKISPKFGAITGGLLLAGGCIIAGLMKSYAGLIIGFGVIGGFGMGMGYAAPTPAALKWFGPEKRGMIAGLVVGGYGGAALYIGWLGQKLIDSYGITGSFVGLGVFFAVVVSIAGCFLKAPPKDYTPPMKKAGAGRTSATEKTHDWEAGDMMKTWQFYALVLMFIFNTQSGLLIISSAKGLMMATAKGMPFFIANAWILVSYGGLVNASGRIGTGMYSDKIGRKNAYCLNCGVSAVCMFLLPFVISSANLFLLFLVVGIAYWQYGGGLSLMPSFTADFFGAKNLGFNYGLVFLGWGLGFFMARVGGVIQDITGSLNLAFYISGALLIAAVILAKLTTKPQYTGQGAATTA
ncbi:MAG: OFA family MFS transporter [Thermodesulfobacteriota bacterium]|nr:OFA family MFS transporter [Thermodesulfobacteriota bacterium]